MLLILSPAPAPIHQASFCVPLRAQYTDVAALGKLDQTKSGGTLLNVRFIPALLKTDEEVAKMGRLIREYFKLGGHHIQFNIVDTATLHDAQKHPEEYRDLLVRVAGYSDYFNDMTLQLQNEIIARTENDEV